MVFDFKIVALLSSLAVLLGLAVWSDLRQHRISNVLSYGGVMTGLGLQLLLSGPQGLLDGTIGIACAALPMLALWMLGGTAAGDVKLMAVVGAFLGGKLAILALVGTMLLGGCMGLVFMLYVRRSGAAGGDRRMPYAPAIALGSGAAVWFAATH